MTDETFEAWCKRHKLDRDWVRRNYPALQQKWQSGENLMPAPLPQMQEINRYREV